MNYTHIYVYSQTRKLYNWVVQKIDFAKVFDALPEDNTIFYKQYTIYYNILYYVLNTI